MSIGIFDSGLGGLTVAKAVMQALPFEKIIYFGDTARTPYGNKSPETVRQYARENTQFLLKKKADMIVVGCNTASAVAGLQLRKEFAEVPLFEVISPAVREALRVSSRGRIAVIGTRNTIKSGAYHKWIPKIRSNACPLFVPLVEAGHLEHPSTYEVAEHYLTPLKAQSVDTLILGCTHYPFLAPVISHIMGNRVQLVDSAQTVAKEVQQFVILNGAKQNEESRTNPVRDRGRDIRVLSLNGTNVRSRIRGRSFASAQDDKTIKHEFYVSKKTPKFQEMAEKWLGMKINLQVAPSL